MLYVGPQMQQLIDYAETNCPDVPLNEGEMLQGWLDTLCHTYNVDADFDIGEPLEGVAERILAKLRSDVEKDESWVRNLDGATVEVLYR